MDIYQTEIENAFRLKTERKIDKCEPWVINELLISTRNKYDLLKLTRSTQLRLLYMIQTL